YAPKDHPCTTEAVLGGVDPYSASKTAAEFVIAPYRDRLSISVARSGNAIGGGDWGKDRLFPDIMRAYQNKTPLHIRHPEATRPWIHVSELMYAYLILGKSNLEGHHTEVFNFGASDSVSVHDILQIVEKYGICPPIIYADSPPKETQQLSLNTKKSERVLGWKPVLDPQESIHWTIEEYRTIPEKRLERMISRMEFLRP
ncbi:MAG: hypothetical protein CL916_07915, partial [Deltaproteobacteria bacterium]|nr:hypothetical protein [Deltaproteobacteria bacterium]